MTASIGRKRLLQQNRSKTDLGVGAVKSLLLQQRTEGSLTRHFGRLYSRNVAAICAMASMGENGAAIPCTQSSAATSPSSCAMAQVKLSPRPPLSDGPIRRADGLGPRRSSASPIVHAGKVIIAKNSTEVWHGSLFAHWRWFQPQLGLLARRRGLRISIG
jgi:hypothetical protein